MAWPIIASLVLSAVGLGIGYKGQKDIQRKQQQANALELKRRNVENARARRAAIAEQNRLRAAVIAEAAASGTSFSSAESGSLSAISASTVGNIGHSQELEDIDRNRFNALQSISNTKDRVEIQTGLLGFAQQGIDSYQSFQSAKDTQEKLQAMKNTGTEKNE